MIAIIAAIVVITLPAINAIQKTSESTGVQNGISAILRTAQSYAKTNGVYTGVRFQQIDGKQYAFIIKHNPEQGGYLKQFIDPNIYTYTFNAVAGYKPIKLSNSCSIANITAQVAKNFDANKTKTSVIFAGTGRMTTLNYHILKPISTNDTVVCDDFFKEEPPPDAVRTYTNLIIYDSDKYSKMTIAQQTQYITDDCNKPAYLNTYTGDIITQDRN